MEDTFEICSCCGIQYKILVPILFKPSAWMDRQKLPACYSCSKENFDTIFRFAFGFLYGIERTNIGDQRVTQTSI
jgi:hypothetical protein